MNEIVFATNNPHKLHEVGSLLGESFKLHNLEDLGFRDRLSEDHETQILQVMQFEGFSKQ
jgi:inosine/xanthosine triphosphate pyrophosphatase family protein